MPRTPQGHQVHERKAREALGHDGTKAKFDERSSGGSSEKIFQEIRDLDEKISEEKIELLEKRQIIGEMSKERRSAEVEEGRDTMQAIMIANRSF